MAGSIREIHSLGVYLPTKMLPTPENLRTVVLVHKHTAAEASPARPGAFNLVSRYEFIFVRARASVAGNRLDLHVFATSDERRKLHYLRSGGSPTNPDDCTINAEVFFTRFGNGGLIPEEAAMRREKVKARSSYDLIELDAHIKRNIALKGDAFDNLLETLDAIIDGKIKPAMKPAATAPTTK